MLQEKIAKILKSRAFWWSFLVILAFVIGFLQSLDSFIVLKDSKNDFGELMVVPADVHLQMMWPQARDVADGYLIPADSWLYEHRLGPPFTPWPWLPPMIYAPFFLIFGAANQLPWSTLVISALAFLLLYRLAYEILGKKILAALFAVLIFCSRLVPIYFFPSSLLELKRLIAVFIPGAFPAILKRMDFMVYESYNPGFLIFGPALIFTVLALKKQKLKMFILAGIFSGLLIYVYPFFWIYQTIFWGCFFILKSIQKDFQAVKRVLMVVAIIIFMAVPFAANEILLAKLGILREFNIRNAGYEIGRYFRLSQWPWYAVWTALSFIIYKLKKNKNKYPIPEFFSLAFTAIFIGLNMQLVLGFNILPDHFIDKVSFLFLGLALFLIFKYFMEWLELRRFARQGLLLGFLSVLICGAVLGAFLEQISEAAGRYGTLLLKKDTWAAIRYLRENAPADSVILSPSIVVNTYTPVLTAHRVFIPHAINTIARESEMLDRRFIVYSLFGVKPEYFAKQLHTPFDEFPNPPINFSVTEQLFLMKYVTTAFDIYLMGLLPSKISEEEIQSIVSKYSDYKLDLASELKKYKIDYVVSDEYSDRIGTVSFEKFPYLELVFKQGKTAIYELNSSRIKK